MVACYRAYLGSRRKDGMALPEKSHARFAAAYSPTADARDACRRVKEQLGGAVDLAFAFVSAQHREEMAELAQTLDDELGARCLLGCTGESLACNGREYEEPGGLALWAAHLPGTTLMPMHLEFQATPEGGAFVGWPDDLPDQWPAGAALFVLGEPFSFPADVLISQLNDSQPGIPVVGGMASGGWGQGENKLILGPREIAKGAAAVLVHGPLKITTVVSQGCRPIGQPFVVTKAERNVILELGGLPALMQLQELFGTLSPEEQALVRGGLHVGQVIDEYRDNFTRGDFLVRNVQGADPDTGGDRDRRLGARRPDGAVSRPRRGHGRRGSERAVASTARSESTDANSGALLFTCNGRGTRLFDKPDHDAAALARHWPQPGWPASSPKAKSARSAARTSCTASPPASRSLNKGDILLYWIK